MWVSLKASRMISGSQIAVSSTVTVKTLLAEMRLGFHSVTQNNLEGLRGLVPSALISMGHDLQTLVQTRGHAVSTH